jgi:hypothetical protein
MLYWFPSATKRPKQIIIQIEAAAPLKLQSQNQIRSENASTKTIYWKAASRSTELQARRDIENIVACFAKEQRLEMQVAAPLQTQVRGNKRRAARQQTLQSSTIIVIYGSKKLFKINAATPQNLKTQNF